METDDDSTDALVIWASLVVAGDFEPADLNALLGVDGKVRRRGDQRSGGRVEPEDSWTYRTAEERSWDWEGHLRRVLAPTAGREDDFVRFCDERGLEREAQLIAKMTAALPIGNADTPAGSLPRDLVATLARLGCCLDIDFYCWCETER